MASELPAKPFPDAHSPVQVPFLLMKPMGHGGPRAPSPTSFATRRRASWVYKDPSQGLLGPSLRAGMFRWVLSVVSPPSSSAAPHSPSGSRVLPEGHRHL